MVSRQVQEEEIDSQSTATYLTETEQDSPQQRLPRCSFKKEKDKGMSTDKDDQYMMENEHRIYASSSRGTSAARRPHASGGLLH